MGRLFGARYRALDGRAKADAIAARRKAKNMTQDAINFFEKSGGAEGPSQFTDAETARHTLGTHSTVASANAGRGGDR